MRSGNYLSSYKTYFVFIWISLRRYNAINGYFIGLNLLLNATERLQLINQLFNNSNNVKSGVTIRMIINDQTKKLGKYLL